MKFKKYKIKNLNGLKLVVNIKNETKTFLLICQKKLSSDYLRAAWTAELDLLHTLEYCDIIELDDALGKILHLNELSKNYSNVFSLHAGEVWAIVIEDRYLITSGLEHDTLFVNYNVFNKLFAECT